MPPIRLSMSKRRALLTASISLDGEIISPCSCCAKKGVVCIIIINPFGYQPFSYTKYTKLNARVLCNVRLILLNKCTFPARLNIL